MHHAAEASKAPQARANDPIREIEVEKDRYKRDPKKTKDMYYKYCFLRPQRELSTRLKWCRRSNRRLRLIISCEGE